MQRQQRRRPQQRPTALLYADQLLADAGTGGLGLVGPDEALEPVGRAANHLISLAIEVKRLYALVGTSAEPSSIELDVARQRARQILGADAMPDEAAGMPIVLLGLQVPIDPEIIHGQTVQEVCLLDVDTAGALGRLLGDAATARESNEAAS